MADIDDFSKAKKIRSLLFVFGSGIAAAFILAFLMLYYYNPSGVYLAKNVLLDPQTINQMKFSDINPQTKKLMPYIFDKIEFTYYDSSQKKFVNLPIDLEKYSQFYAMVANDKSITEAQDEIQSLFYTLHPSTLSLKVRAENDQPKFSKTFNESMFAENGDYFRVFLREQERPEKGMEGWAYFFHPGIYEKVLKLFVPS